MIKTRNLISFKNLETVQIKRLEKTTFPPERNTSHSASHSSSSQTCNPFEFDPSRSLLPQSSDQTPDTNVHVHVHRSSPPLRSSLRSLTRRRSSTRKLLPLSIDELARKRNRATRSHMNPKTKSTKHLAPPNSDHKRLRYHAWNFAVLPLIVSPTTGPSRYTYVDAIATTTFSIKTGLKTLLRRCTTSTANWKFTH